MISAPIQSPEVQPEPGRLEETVWVAALRAGDEAAYERLVREKGRWLLGLARHMLGNEEDARDVVQETFLAAFRGVGRFHGQCLLGTWLRKIAVNQCLMKIRSRARKPAESIETHLPKFLEDGHQAEASQEWLVPADLAVERRELRTLVKSSIEKLPVNYRTVLVLRDIEELDSCEVAKLLALTPNTVKVRLHRARQALRALLDPHLRPGVTNEGREARPLHPRVGELGITQ